MTVNFGPKPIKARSLRKWEAIGDGFVKFGQQEALRHFARRHPLLWQAYLVCVKIRCLRQGHEYSRMVKTETMNDLVVHSTHCLYCGERRDLTCEWPVPAPSVGISPPPVDPSTRLGVRA